MDLKTSSRIVALLAAGSLALTACGDDDDDNASTTGTTPTPDAPAATTEAPAPSGPEVGVDTIAGAGSSAQSAAMTAWIAGFTDQATVNYDPVGSSGGRRQFLDGGVAFAGSDAALDADELAEATSGTCGGAAALNIPLYISPIAIIYNLEGVDNLQLAPATVAKIFDQKITNWNDPAIAADNPGVTLPDLAITPVNRSDGSGTTENFTEYLAAAAGADWPYEPDGDWPVSGGEAANGTSGVVQAVGEADGGIGYADESQRGDLGAVAVKVGEEYAGPTAELAAQAVSESEQVPGREANDLALEINRTPAAGYPISLVSYQIVCSTYPDTEVGKTVKAFLTYAASDEGQAASASAAGSAPISGELKTKIDTAIASIS